MVTISVRKGKKAHRAKMGQMPSTHCLWNMKKRRAITPAKCIVRLKKVCKFE
jgi:hypothetical protein